MEWKNLMELVNYAKVLWKWKTVVIFTFLTVLAGTLVFTFTMIAPLIQMSSISTQFTEAFAGLDRIHEVLSEDTEDIADADRSAAGVLASVCWFTAFTLENAAHVRAVGQIELIFTFIASVFFFGEKSNRAEIFGIVLVAAGIVMLLLTR